MIMLGYGPSGLTQPAIWEEKESHALRAAHLQLYPRSAASAAQAVRGRDSENLGDARHQAGRLLDRADRREQQRPLLFPGLGVAGRAREEVDRLHERSR